MIPSCGNSLWSSFVEVAFNRINMDVPQPDPVKPLYVSPVNLNVVIPSGSAVGHPGGKIIHDLCPAYYTASTDANPTNKTVLDNLAKQIATDYYNYRSINFDIVYNGIVSWTGDGITNTVEYTYTADDISTRVKTGPLDDYPEEFMHYNGKGLAPGGAVFLTSTSISGTFIVSGTGRQAGTGIGIRYDFDGVNLIPFSPTVTGTIYSMVSGGIPSGTIVKTDVQYNNTFWIDAESC